MAERARAPGGRGRHPATGAVRTRPTLAAQALSLQRAVGNRAMRRILARDEASAPTFRLLIADEGAHGLSDAIVNNALPMVRDELARITKDSAENAVKAGFDVQYVKAKPVRNDEFTRSLGRSTFLIFMTSGKDPAHAIETMRDYIPMNKDEQQQFETKFKNSIAKEGGVDLGYEPNQRRRTSQSVGFVSSKVPIAELKKSGAGPASASAVLADVILHELGHAVGHNITLSAMDHDRAGIMTPQLVLGSSGAHPGQKFSNASAKIIRDRLEELAKRMAPKRP